MQDELGSNIEVNEHVTPEMKAKIVEALENVIDPEIQLDIINLGLVYRIDMDESGNTKITMTLTAMGCPLAGTIVMLVKNALKNVPGVGEVDVDIVFNPPWSKDRVSRLGKMALGIR